jgi:hypothetical protein
MDIRFLLPAAIWAAPGAAKVVLAAAVFRAAPHGRPQDTKPKNNVRYRAKKWTRFYIQILD